MIKEQWAKEESDWQRETSVSKEVSMWAIQKTTEESRESRKPPKQAIAKENLLSNALINELNHERNYIKSNLHKQESKLDNLSPVSPNSYKLQVSVPVNINYLIKAWAAAEGRDLASIALQCLEIGIRESRAKGVVPMSAIKLYENACEKRIALAELKNKWETFESKINIQGESL